MTCIIGITGGIGSGKSTLAACFRASGIPVIDADEIARKALTPDSECFQEIIAVFGEQALLSDGSADRAYISKRAFHNQQLLDHLNAIIHPYVIRTMIKQTELSDAPLAVWDVPLLFESGCDAFCACTIAVVCSEEIRIRRVMQRDGLMEKQVRARMKHQTTDAYRIECATYTVYNEKSEIDFCKSANDLIERIRKELS